jgi:hypothetical protein
MNFGVVIAGLMGLFFVAVLALGWFYPGTGADVLDWRPTRSVEVEAELELDELDQMLEAQNERRRRRGERERTLEEVELQVAGDLAEQRRRRDAYQAAHGSSDEAQRDLDDMLAAANERRRRRGQAPVGAEHYRPDAPAS